MFRGEPPEDGKEVGCEAGVVEGARQMLGASATAHVEAVGGKTGFKQRLRERDHVAATGGAFEAVMKKDMAARMGLRQVLLDQDLGSGLGVIVNLACGEARFVDRAFPEVTGERGEMGIPEEGDEGPQTSILANRGGDTAD